MIVRIGKTPALAIHDRQLAKHGGIPGVRDEGLLGSMLARHEHGYRYGDPPPDLADHAASLAFGLAHNHPFMDGNKRTAHACYRVFLALNDTELKASDEEKYVNMVALVEGGLTEQEFADWLQPLLVLAGNRRSTNRRQATRGAELPG